MNNNCAHEKKSFDLICMGRVAVDLYAEQIGASLSDAQSFRKYLGGCAGNIAVGAARLGLRVSMLSCVGSDELGHFLQRELMHEGVDISHLQTSENKLTGLVLLGVNPPDRFPLMFYRNDCADMAIDENKISKEFVSSARALLVTGTGLSHPKTKAVTMHAITVARDVGTQIILDIDYRPVLWGKLPPGDGENRYVYSKEISDVFSSVLPLCDLIVGTEEEVLIAGGENNFDAALTAIREKTSALIVVKKGADGAMCVSDKICEPIIAQTKPAEVVNVLGAGDGFLAGFLSGYLADKNLDAALERGNAAGALVVSRHGCSHACPSREELEYVLAHRNDDDVQKTSMVVEKIHHRIVLKDHRRRSFMPVLAFCHRWQMEEACDRYEQSYEKIINFKLALSHAFVDASGRSNFSNAFMLCDPHYGRSALAFANSKNTPLIVAIEKSGARLTEWLSDESAYEILHARPPSWGVKLLWHFHDDMSENESAHQIKKLKELARACKKLDRKLMLELIVPKEYAPTDDDITHAVARVYREDVQPYWWKLSRFTTREGFVRLGRTIDEYDSRARVLILGGDAKDLSSYAQDFSIAQSSHHGIGFAVGRSIFWPSFLAYLTNDIDLDQVQKDVSARFLSLCEMWQHAQKK